MAMTRFRTLRLYTLALQLVFWIFAPFSIVGAQGLYFDEPVEFFVGRPTLDVSLRTRFASDYRSRRDASVETEKLLSMLGFRLRTEGFVYHPALVTYDLSLEPLLEQRRFEFAGSSNKSSNDHFGYSLQMNCLQYKPYTINIGASSRRIEQSNNLQQDTIHESQSRDVRLTLKSRSIPTRLSYQTYERSTSGYYFVTEDKDTWLLSSQFATSKSETRLSADRQAASRRRSLSAEINTDSNRVALHNTWQPSDNATLNSTASMHDSERSNFTVTQQNASSSLSLEHPLSFESQWTLMISDAKNGSAISNSTGASAGISHQLYENLNSSVQLQQMNTSTSAGDRDENVFIANVNYTRRIPTGRVAIGAGRSIRDFNDQRNESIETIFDEPYTFDGIESSVVLANPYVDLESIEVTDSDGLIIYEPGIDYVAEIVGNVVLITRDSFGAINDGETILVSYRYTTNPASIGSIDSYSYHGRIELGLLSMFYAKGESRVSTDFSAAASLTEEQFTRAYGFGLALRNATTEYRVSERNLFLNSFRERSLRQTLRLNSIKGFETGLTAEIRDWKFLETGEERFKYDLNISGKKRIGITGRLNIRMGLRNEEIGTIKTRGLHFSTGYSWRYGQWSNQLQYSVQESSIDARNIEYGRQQIYFSTKRHFR